MQITRETHELLAWVDLLAEPLIYFVLVLVRERLETTHMCRGTFRQRQIATELIRTTDSWTKYACFLILCDVASRLGGKNRGRLFW